MTKVNEVYTTVKEALSAGHIVYITDATETRKVIDAEYSLRTLTVLADHGDGEVKPWPIAVTWPWDELDGWALDKLGEDLYIAPEWWFQIGDNELGETEGHL